jgi:hypothetical protein
MLHDWLQTYLLCFVNTGLSTAEQELASVAVQQQCCQLYSMQSSNSSLHTSIYSESTGQVQSHIKQ